MTAKSIKLLDLQDKESIVALLMDVTVGNVSCRRAADEIMNKLPRAQLSKIQRASVRKMARDGYRVSHISSVYKISTTTVWRICKRQTP